MTELNKHLEDAVTKEYLNYETAIIDDPETDFKNHIAFIQSVATKYNLPLQLVENETISLEYNFKEKSFKNKSEKTV